MCLCGSSPLGGKNGSQLKRCIRTRRCGSVERDCSRIGGFCGYGKAIARLQANAYDKSFLESLISCAVGNSRFHPVKGR